MVRGDTDVDLQDKIIERLLDKKADLSCPVCRSSQVITRQNSFVDLPIRDQQDGELTKIRCMYMTCSKCGYVTLFDAKVALS
jgi:predicted nucleic-acid-binding Zn-ribbon protein